MVPPLPNSTSLLCGEVVWVDELDDGGDGVGLLLLFMFLGTVFGSLGRSPYMNMYYDL